MPDLTTRVSTVVRFSTTSDDYKAVVRGVGVSRPIKEGDRIPTEHPGLFTISVFDRQLRRVKVTLTDTSQPPSSTPPSATREHAQLVVIAYEVRS
jgi:hypothetical protein